MFVLPGERLNNSIEYDSIIGKDGTVDKVNDWANTVNTTVSSKTDKDENKTTTFSKNVVGYGRDLSGNLAKVGANALSFLSGGRFGRRNEYSGKSKINENKNRSFRTEIGYNPKKEKWEDFYCSVTLVQNYALLVQDFQLLHIFKNGTFIVWKIEKVPIQQQI